MFDALVLLGSLGLLLIWLRALQVQVKVRSQVKDKVSPAKRRS